MVVEAANNGLEISGEAAVGVEALKEWRANPAVVVILDNRMPGMNGIEVAEQILAESPGQHIILFSAYLDPDTEAAARRVGVRRCLDKTQISRLPGELWALEASA